MLNFLYRNDDDNRHTKRAIFLIGITFLMVAAMIVRAIMMEHKYGARQEAFLRDNPNAKWVIVTIGGRTIPGCWATKAACRAADMRFRVPNTRCVPVKADSNLCRG